MDFTILFLLAPSICFILPIAIYLSYDYYQRNKIAKQYKNDLTKMKDDLSTLRLDMIKEAAKEVLVVSDEDWNQLMDAIKNPPEPNKKLKDLIKKEHKDE